MYNASNRKDIRRAEKAARQVQVAKEDFVRAAMNTIQGRQWFWDLLSACHIFQEPVTDNPNTDARLKGERTIGLMIYTDIMAACPDQYTQMWKEANARSLALTNSRPDLDAEPDIFDNGYDPGDPGQSGIIGADS